MKKLVLILNLSLIPLTYASSHEDLIQKAKQSGRLNFARQPTKTLPYFIGSDLNPIWLKETDPKMNQTLKIAEFSFKNQLNRPITHEEMNKRISIVNFFFTSCGGYCPRIMKNLEPVQKTFLKENDIQILSYSVTPVHDTPSVLEKFGKERGIHPHKWKLITGNREKIYELARTSYFADTKTELAQGEKEFIHSEHVYLIDSNRRIRGIYNGNNPNSITQLIQDAQSLKKESSL